MNNDNRIPDRSPVPATAAASSVSHAEAAVALTSPADAAVAATSTANAAVGLTISVDSYRSAKSSMSSSNFAPERASETMHFLRQPQGTIITVDGRPISRLVIAPAKDGATAKQAGDAIESAVRRHLTAEE